MLLLTLAGVLFATLFVLTSRRGRDMLLFVIGVTAAFDQAQVEGLHVSSALAVLLVAYPETEPLGPVRKRRLVTLSVGVLLLASTVFFGELVNSRLIGLQMVVFTVTAIFICWKSDEKAIETVLRGLWLGLLFTSAHATLQYVGLVPSQYYADSSGIDRVVGFYREPDFLAYFASVGLVLTFRVIQDARLRIFGSGLFAFILVVSFARASYVGLIVSTVVVLVARGFPRLLPGRRPPVWLTATLGIAVTALLTINDQLRSTLAQRITDALASSSSSDAAIRARSGQLESLMGLAETAPWYGWGLSAAGRVQDLGVVVLGDSINNVATNWVLDWWVGGKFLSAPLILFVLWLVFRGRNTVPGFLLLMTAITSLFTNAMILPITFILMGLCLRELGSTDRGVPASSNEGLPAHRARKVEVG